MNGDQDAVFAFLTDPATHGLTTPVSRVDTNAAAVFLAGPDVYKVKRAVRFPFMDLSTLEKRRVACETEVAVNRRYAPDLYRGVVPVTRDAGGSFHLGGDGEVVEWVVHMRRFDETRTLDLVADRGELTPEIIRRLAGTVIDSFANAEIRDGKAATEALHGVVVETTVSLMERREVFEPARATAFAEAMRAQFRRNPAPPPRPRRARPCPPRPRRPAPPQHRPDRRQPGAVRRHRVR